MRYTYLITLLILASATLGSAQFEGSDLSKGCTDALQKMVGDKDINACLPLLSLASLAGSDPKDSKPDINALKTAADKVCALPKCSEDLVSKTQQDFQTACQSDLNAKKDVVMYLDLTFDFYSPTRDSVCFKNSTGDYCFIESALAAYQVAESAPKDQSPLFTFLGAPKEVVCTPCNKAISNTYFNYQKTNPKAFTKLQQVTSQDPDTLKSTLTSKCGDSFLDGDTSGSDESPKSFQEKNENDKSDASTLIVNGLSFIALAGSALALL